MFDHGEEMCVDVNYGKKLVYEDGSDLKLAYQGKCYTREEVRNSIDTLRPIANACIRDRFLEGRKENCDGKSVDLVDPLETGIKGPEILYDYEPEYTTDFAAMDMNY